MFELTSLGNGEYYVKCAAQFGVIGTGDGEVCLIDSGPDAGAGEKLGAVLEEKGWRLRAVYLSHGHADHAGGCRRLQEHTGCAVYAAGAEQVFASRPVLDPAFLYGGDPPPEIRTPMLMPEPSRVLPLTEQSLPEGWSAVPLPGHTYDMVGYRTPGGAVFLADCLSSRQTLEAHPFTFLTDVAAYLGTLRAVRETEASVFVPAHAPVCEDIRELAELNERHVLRLGELIRDLCAEPAVSEDILKRLFDALGLTLNWFDHALSASTLRSFLTWLKNEGQVEALFEDNRLLWKKI